MLGRLFGHVICGQTCIRMGSDIFWSQGLWQLNQRAHPGSQQFCVTAIGADAGELTSFNVHIVTSARGKRETIGDQRVANDRITTFKSRDSFSYVFYPTGIFVSHYVGQLNVDFLAPDTLDDMKIGATNTGAADPHDHIGRVLYLRFWYFLQSDIVGIG